MPIFDIEHGGQAYQVDAPDASAAHSAFQKMLGAQPPAAAPGPALAPPAQSDIAGLSKAAASGLGNFAVNLAGFPGDVGTLGAQGLDVAAQALGAPPREAGPPLAGFNFPGSQDIRRGVESVTGPFYKPQNVAEEYVQAGAEFAPNALLGPGGVGRRILTQAALPAVASKTAGLAARASDTPEAEPYAEAAGAILGAATPGGFARTVTPIRADPLRTAQANLLRAEGIPLTAGQSTGSGIVRTAESPLSHRLPENQLEALTGAVFRRAGETANRATPDNVDAMLGRIGGEFDRLAGGNSVQFDRPFLRDVTDAVRDYRSLTGPGQRVGAVDDAVEAINQSIRQTGGMTGAQYQAQRSRLGRLERASTDPQASHALGGIREALDNAMERSIAANNPADLGAWREARNQYRNALVIERAATTGSTRLGLIEPSALKSATQFVHGRRNYARGRGDFSELAHAADDVMSVSGGIPLRAGVFAPSAALGGALGTAMGGPMGGTVGALSGPMAQTALVNSPPMQAYLRNQLFGQTSSTLPRDVLMQALTRLPPFMAAQPRD